MQDFLCDSSMIPYPEPYQSMYQQRRLGALGIEWRPPSLNFAVGPAHNINHDGHDVQLLPFIDLDRVVEPLPEFLDAIDWEPENEIQSDDTDSEYNVTDECSSEGERESLCFSSSGDPECSAEDSEFDHDNKEGLRRSKRKKRKSEVEFTTSSGRRVKRRNLDERDGTLSMKVRKKRRKGRFGLRRKSSKSASLRPQRRAARNALTYFSRINGASTDVEEEDESETDSSENDSLPPELNQSNESDRSIQDIQQKYKREEELSLDECDSVAGPSQVNEPRLNPGIRRLVLKLPARASKKAIPPEKLESGYPEQDDTMGVSTIPEKVDQNATGLKPPESAMFSVDMAVASVAENGGETRSRVGGQDEKYVERPDLSAGFKDRRIKWGEVKARSSKRLRLEDSSIMEGHVNPDGHNDLDDKINGHFKLEDEYERTSFECGSRAQADNPDHDVHKNENQFVDAAEECHDGGRNKDLNVEYARQPSTNVRALPDDFQQGVTSSVPCNGIINAESLCTNDGYRDHKRINESMGHNDFCERDEMLVNNKITPEKHQGIGKNAQPPIYRRLRIKSRGFAPRSPSEKLKSVGATDDPRSSLCDLLSDSLMQIGRNVDEGEGTSEQQSPEHDDDSKGKMVVIQTDDLKIVHPNSTNNKMYNAVYRRSKSYRDRNCFGNDIHAMEESTSNSNSQNERPNLDFPEADLDVRRTRSMNTRMASSQWKPAVSDLD
ncbi:hypothetical protein QJS10_CPA16g01646 [Acorus calamus]|uniref:Uncharacterized protein n=1 Tax=Acorus calamus TaxID=4465 RepID=A0AAV9CZT6_ACOCL|nr:hypothetical protein QJS10_CPA16g01646 [Acorus calamus]